MATEQCDKCGAERQRDDVFCSECGHSFDRNAKKEEGGRKGRPEVANSPQVSSILQKHSSFWPDSAASFFYCQIATLIGIVFWVTLREGHIDDLLDAHFMAWINYLVFIIFESLDGNFVLWLFIIFFNIIALVARKIIIRSR